MKYHTLNCITLAMGLTFGASAFAADTMTKAELKDAKTKIEADYKAALVPCDSLAGNPKKICTVEAKGNKKTYEELNAINEVLLDAAVAYWDWAKAEDEGRQKMRAAGSGHTTIKLKPDLKWADGKPVTTKDLEFTWRIGRDPKCVEHGGIASPDPCRVGCPVIAGAGVVVALLRLPRLALVVRTTGEIGRVVPGLPRPDLAHRQHVSLACQSTCH